MHPAPDEVVAFFRAITDAVPIPWMVYNWPRGTAVDIDVEETVLRLAEFGPVEALKDSTGDEVKCARACEAVVGQLRFLGRFIDRLGLAFYRELGGDGNIDGGGLGARYAVPYFVALWKGELESAGALGARYVALSRLLVNSDYMGGSHLQRPS